MKTNKFFEEYCKDNIILNFEGDIHTFNEGVAFVFSHQHMKMAIKHTLRPKPIRV